MSFARSRSIATLAVGAAMLAACAGGGGMYDQPYALFQPEGRSVPADTRPAFVLKVDGTDRAINSNDPVAPGVRQLMVSVPGARGMSESQQDTITIDAKPCTRYYLAAKRSAPTTSDWKAFVSSVEPIGECRKKFPAVN